MNPQADAAVDLADILTKAAVVAGMEPRDIGGVKQLSGGASSEVWAFDLATDDGIMPLVLRRQPAQQRFSSPGPMTLSTEAQVMRAAKNAGVPVPHVLFELPEDLQAGEGFAMERIEGETIGGRILKLPELAAARGAMTQQCGEILATLHKADVGSVQLDLENVGPQEALAALEQRYRDTGQARPVFEYALRWLADNLPDDDRRVLLHGDFRNGNLIVGPQGIRAVLDWELAQVGPPAYDLGWLCVNSWRFQNPHLPVGGFGSREELLAAYQAEGGAVFGLEELHAWEVFQTMHWGVICAGAGKSFEDGNRSVEGGVIARRASETEFDLLRLLMPDSETWHV